MKIDNSKCISCGKCEEACEVGSIQVAHNEEEYKKIKKEIDADPRKISDLFIDRYGAELKQTPFLIEKGFDIEILQSKKLAVLEIFSEESIRCLLYSIPIKELFKNFSIKYRKMEAKDGSLLKQYKVKKLPCLLFFQDGKLIGKIEGHYGFNQKEELKAKINKIVRKK